MFRLKSKKSNKPSLGAGKKSRTGRVPTRYFPRLEPLENRAVPALFTVSSLADSGAGTLRQAILNANTTAGADDIEFQSSLSGTITLTSGELAISDSVSITGPAAGVTISGNNSSRIFNVNAGVAALIDVEIVGLTLTNGSCEDPTGGGAILNHENLTLTNCTLSNSNTGFEGEIGGGMYNLGTVTLTSCILSNNMADREGGGLYNDGTVTLIDCILSSNSASGTGSNLSGGGLLNNGTATLTNCTLSSNSAGFGGGLSNSFGTATLHNTIVANSVAAQEIFILGGTVTGSHNLIEDGSGTSAWTSPAVRPCPTRSAASAFKWTPITTPSLATLSPAPPAQALSRATASSSTKRNSTRSTRTLLAPMRQERSTSVTRPTASSSPITPRRTSSLAT
jgi:hypothetical protein